MPKQDEGGFRHALTTAMHVSDIVRVLEQTSAACASAGLPFTAFPMHEVAAHPRAPKVLRLCSSYSGYTASDGGQPMFEPLSTTGVPLALRRDPSGA
ncbi:MAG: hypothetical protein PVSMB4_00910 [Ktedonobacterales bacterium]